MRDTQGTKDESAEAVVEEPHLNTSAWKKHCQWLVA